MKRLAVLTVAAISGLLLAFLTPVSAEAASATFTIGGTTYKVRTNTSGGDCNVTPSLQYGGSNVDCDDGSGNRAIGNTNVACLSAVGSGQCTEMPPPADTNATTDGSCPSGDTFTISTGTSGGTCSITKNPGGDTTGGSCGDGSNTSGFDCSANGGDGDCTGSGGSGSCVCKTCRP
jgi:hypothetical protein